MRTFLLVCDAFASEFDVKFNALKSKLLVCMPSSRCKQPASYLSSCQFFIYDNPIERVDSFLHLGHVITSNLSDKEDILFRRDRFITKANNVLCYFNKLSCSVTVKLFKAYCNVVANCGL